ncbi:MAG: rhomboid family intramembrane serine protease, partial [Eubacteriales bacterium]|nr:rhomboid family intramembrane serine protease [Eubacteriales bacterium]
FILVFIHFFTLSKNIHTKIISLGSTTPNMLYNKEYYRILTASFLHSGISHLSSNCLSLYIFGSRVEKYMGKFNFILIYFLGTVSSSLFSCFFSNSYSIGASGAIFALEGAILYYSLKTKRKIDNLDFYVFILLAIVGISSGFLSDNIDNAGHIGGFIAGIITSCIIYFFQRKKV